MLLALDTATRFISIALYDGTNLVAEQTWQSYNNHTVQLAPAVFTLLDSSDLEMEDLTAIGVSIGPGSYTGLRIGVSLAKGLASARKLPLVGVTTLDTLAASQPYYQSGSGLVIVVQAGRGRVIVKTYRWRKGQWASRTEPQLMDWNGLLAHIDGPALISGEIDEEGMDILRQAQSDNLPITLAPGAHRMRRAGFLAQTAWDILHSAADKSAFTAARLIPIYIKNEDGSENTAPATPAAIPAHATTETPAVIPAVAPTVAAETPQSLDSPGETASASPPLSPVEASEQAAEGESESQ
jgi:tRNA threonylcarbamoyladenosine biosynthesis protein TsaB